MQNRFLFEFNDEKPLRLDKYLVKLNIPELYSRTLIEKLITEKNIVVNNEAVKKSHLLTIGDTINITFPVLSPVDIEPQDIPLDVIFEDKYLAVINKSAGLVIHPGHGNPDHTLVNAIAYKFGGNLPTMKGNNRPGIVHRLDKDTSGVLLIAKDDKTQSLLSDMFAKRAVKKTYLAITTGIPENTMGKIENYISRDKSNPRKMSVNKEGRIALSYFKVIRYYLCFALLEVMIESGRMHQIRVHMEHMNNPVLGDKLYNSIKRVQAVVPDNLKKKVRDLLSNQLQRQALHAWKISLSHPYSLKELTFTAPIPDDFIYALDWLEKYFAIDNVGYDKNMLIC